MTDVDLSPFLIKPASSLTFDIVAELNGARPKMPLSGWRIRPPTGYANVGDFIRVGFGPTSPSTQNPDVQCIFIKLDFSNDTIRYPVDMILMYNDKGSGAKTDWSIWRPVAPDGYVALGDVNQLGYDKPPLTSVVCVRKDLVLIGNDKTNINSKFIGNDAGSDARMNMSSYYNSLYHTFYTLPIKTTADPNGAVPTYLALPDLARGNCCADQRNLSTCGIMKKPNQECPLFMKSYCTDDKLKTSPCTKYALTNPDDLQEPVLNYCRNNMNSNFCISYCNANPSKCVGTITGYCADAYKAGKAFTTVPLVDSTKGDTKNNSEICACYMPSEYYQQYFNDLYKLTPGLKGLLDQNPRCSFGPCQRASIQNPTLSTTCPSNNICVQQIQYDVDGRIDSGSIQNNASCNIGGNNVGSVGAGSAGGSATKPANNGAVSDTKSGLFANPNMLYIVLVIIAIILVSIVLNNGGSSTTKDKHVKGTKGVNIQKIST